MIFKHPKSWEGAEPMISISSIFAQAHTCTSRTPKQESSPRSRLRRREDTGCGRIAEHTDEGRQAHSCSKNKKTRNIEVESDRRPTTPGKAEEKKAKRRLIFTLLILLAH